MSNRKVLTGIALMMAWGMTLTWGITINSPLHPMLKLAINIATAVLCVVMAVKAWKKSKAMVVASFVVGFAAVLTCIGFALLISSGIGLTEESVLEHKTGLKVPRKMEILESHDSGESFLGDGHRYVVYHLDDDQLMKIKNQEPLNAKWIDGPVDANIQAGINGFVKALYKENNIKHPLPMNDSETTYYFRDRNVEQDPGSKNIPFMNRVSYNFTLVILDEANKRLHVYYKDT